MADSCGNSASDPSHNHTDIASSTSPGASSSTASNNGTTTSKTNSSNDSERNGVSPGAIAGIAVGTALAAALLGIIGAICLMRRRKRQRVAASHDSRSLSLSSSTKIPLGGFDTQTMFEPMSQDVLEMSGDPHVQEMNGGSKPVEMSSEKTRTKHYTTRFELGSP